jgi:hypothetical protein
VCEYLNTRFPGRWIGRAALIAWPPCLRILHPWIILPITIPCNTWCGLLHYNSSKHSTRPINKLTSVFKVAKLFLKHSISELNNLGQNLRWWRWWWWWWLSS